MCELFQVVNVVLVSLNIKTEIHTSEFIQFSHVYVISEVITSEVSLLFAMLFNSLQELLELLLTLEDINLFRFDFFGLSFFQFLSSMTGLFTEVSKSFLLKSFLLLDLHHVFLELLSQIKISIVAFRARLLIILHGILLFRLLIE
jgi:hypothetical protein